MELQLSRFEVEIRGLSPLLMHQDNLEYQDETQAKGAKDGKPGDDRHPADRWKSYLYTDIGRKHVVVPAENIVAALGKVGGSINIGSKKSLKQASQSIMFDDIDLPMLVGPKAVPVDFDAVLKIGGTFAEQAKQVSKLGFMIFVKRCVINNKARHIRTRPRFDHWALRGTFASNSPLLTRDRVQTLFDTAGQVAGLCDWRPGNSKPGPFGRFEATVTEL